MLLDRILKLMYKPETDEQFPERLQDMILNHSATKDVEVVDDKDEKKQGTFDYLVNTKSMPILIFSVFNKNKTIEQNTRAHRTVKYLLSEHEAIPHAVGAYKEDGELFPCFIVIHNDKTTRDIIHEQCEKYDQSIHFKVTHNKRKLFKVLREINKNGMIVRHKTEKIGRLKSISKEDAKKRNDWFYNAHTDEYFGV
jgi:hypothetical protein